MLDESTQESTFDPSVLADTLYYIEPLTPARLKSIARALCIKLNTGGLLLLVNHYFFGIDKASRGTREIHDSCQSAPGFIHVAEYRRAFFLTTLLRRTDS
jgi:hypothetical protein